MSEFGYGVTFGMFLSILCTAFVHWTERGRREYAKSILNENAALKMEIELCRSRLTTMQEEDIDAILAQEQEDEVPD